VKSARRPVIPCPVLGVGSILLSGGRLWSLPNGKPGWPNRPAGWRPDTSTRPSQTPRCMTCSSAWNWAASALDTGRSSLISAIIRFLVHEMMRHLDLFSGIGGFALAVDTVWPNSEHVFCDNDKFCQAVLRKHWPDSKIYGDIRTVGLTRLQADGIIGACHENEASDSTRPLVCMNVDCPSRKSLDFLPSADKQCGLPSRFEDADLDPKNVSGKPTAFIAERGRMDTRKTLSNMQSAKASSNEKKSVNPAETSGRSKTDAQKFKHTISITTNHCLSCGSASDAITNGTKTIKQSSVYETNRPPGTHPAGGIDLLTGGFP
jgi:hypothetical protein